MPLKDFIENHPISILVGVAVVVASASASVVHYLKDDLHNAELTKVTSEHERKLHDLENRLVSIERKLGEGEAFFDVSKLLIPASALRTLGQEYKTMADGTFFVASPTDNQWAYSLTSEFEMFKSMVEGFDPDDPGLAELESAAGKKNVHLWQNKRSQFRFRTRPPQLGRDGIAFAISPYVGVQVIQESELATIVAGLHTALNREKPDASEVIEELTALSEEMSAGVDERDTAILPNSDADLTATTESTGELHLKPSTPVAMEAALSEFFRGDLASIVLSGFLNAHLMTPQVLPGSTVNITSIQKKGNVVYLQVAITYNNVEFLDDHPGSSFKIFQEIFIATNSDYLIILKTQVPTIDGRSDAFSWISQWLAGIRLPIPAASQF